MADDLGYGDLSTYGGWIDTPNLDRMAAEGLKFTDFHSNGAVCSPTRAALMTGRYQQRAGVPIVIFAPENRPTHVDGLQDSEWTFAEALQEAGYATAIFGKWHLGYYPQYNPVRHGFAEFKGYVSGNVDFFSYGDGQRRRAVAVCRFLARIHLDIESPSIRLRKHRPRLPIRARRPTIRTAPRSTPAKHALANREWIRVPVLNGMVCLFHEDHGGAFGRLGDGSQALRN